MIHRQHTYSVHNHTIIFETSTNVFPGTYSIWGLYIYMQSEAFRFEKSFAYSPKPSKRQNDLMIMMSNKCHIRNKLCFGIPHPSNIFEIRIIKTQKLYKIVALKRWDYAQTTLRSEQLQISYAKAEIGTNKCRQ